MLEKIELTESQWQSVEDAGFVRLSLDEAIEVLKPYDITLTKLAGAFGMLRGNIRTQFDRGCQLDLNPDTGEIKMVRVEKILKEGSIENCLPD